MTISDALPVQFWINGVETYNQKEVCGITPVCFCQPFNSTDEIRVQAQEETGLILLLKIYDTAGNEIQSLSFTEIASGVYEMSFVSSELSITDEQVRLQINRSYGELENGTFTSSLTPWTNVGSGESWQWNANEDNSALLQLSTAGLDINSKYLTQDFNTYTGVQYTISLNAPVLDWVSGGGDGLLNLYFSNGSTRDLAFSYAFNDADGSISESQIFTALNNYDQVEIYVVLTNTLNPTELNFFLTSASVTAEDAILALSDCLDIKTSHDCTTLIRYDNAKDFAGLEYSSFSPTAEFYLRIPAIFFHERNPEEEESFEESTENIVRLRNEIKLKKLLEVGFMPDYMHRKLLLILAHDTVEIDGESWVKRDPYEKEEPSNKRYPLKKASVLLTQKDYIKRNIL